ncbi:radical SAM protein [Desulforhopalus sp. IMCC35007]|uniref:radical SAM protein n=1 Tax=Desulforhopalus sp. IMCC35007 TaxID=2569543 RepID=UPI0010AE0841|nr:radical SAM protein [Desulforhopalus sp. IMCC35007]TKB06728.1 radical SAM protein [Desulforhopalus sp. IMCC35007]
MQHPDRMPCLLFADKDGNITEFPELEMVGMSNGKFFRPNLEDIIALPEGSELFALPSRLPVGWDRTDNEPALLAEDPYTPGGIIQAVAAFIAPAHTSIYNSSFQTEKKAPVLPLFAYTAVGWHDNQFWVTAFRSDDDVRQDSDQYSQEKVRQKTETKLSKFPDNRLIQHLGKCCLTYGCPAARNYFLERWEAPLPTSPSCNARCIGCISLQESGCCPSTQDRIKFVPEVKEIAEIAIHHLKTADNPIVSFGQGCEGEPLLQAETLKNSILEIRKHTLRGTINLNSNSSLPDKVEQLADAGLNSIRVSLNSAQEKYYKAYYRPINYSFADVMRSIDVMKEKGRFVSLNYFVFPGFTDSENEFAALCKLIENHQPDFIQLRNFNMDPEIYLNTLNLPENTVCYGVRNWLGQLKAKFPALKFGYFNPQVNPDPSER